MERELFLDVVSAQLRGRGRAPCSPSRFSPMGAPCLGSADERARRFLQRQAELGVVASPVEDRERARAAVELVLKEEQTIVCSSDLCWPALEPRWTQDVAVADLGLCEADWAIAETGSVVLTMGGARRRDTSLLPPAVGFFVKKSRVVARLGDVLRSLAGSPAHLPTCVTMITGPSASADIVGVRVVGVHGPGDVHVWLIEDE
jgi:L-lactate utilization protein LutC